MKTRTVLLGAAFLVLCAVAAQAGIVVGSGPNAASAYVEFKDGATYTFDVHFSSSSLTGLGLFDAIEAGTSLTTARDDFGWGIFIDGITYDGHSNSGYGGGEDWWHYWVKDGAAAAWVSPEYGVADRIGYNGYADGWVYGRAGEPATTEPVAEPAPLCILLGAGVLLLRRRRSA